MNVAGEEESHSLSWDSPTFTGGRKEETSKENGEKRTSKEGERLGLGEIPAFCEAEAGESLVQEFKTSLAKMVKPRFY